MNASLVILGMAMIIGSALFYRQIAKNKGARLGFIFMGVGGLGTILVGLFPSNSVASLHAIGAFLPFLIGNLSLLLFAAFLDLPKVLRAYAWLAGLVSLIAFILFISGTYLGLGIGGMERIVAHPQTLWLIFYGIYVLKLTHTNNPKPLTNKQSKILS